MIIITVIRMPYSWCIATALMYMLTPVWAQNTPPDWKSECVGRTQLSLPVGAQVAGYTYDRLAKEMISGSGQQRFEFADGEKAGWSHLAYSGDVYVSNALSVEQISALTSSFLAEKNELKKRLKNSVSTLHRGTPVGDIFSGMDHVLAWSVGTSIRTLIRLENHVLSMTVDEDEKGLEVSRNRFKELAINTQVRTLYSVPALPGICLPYAFIQDDGHRFRNIAMTYRLASHPDVSVLLKDGIAGKYDSPFREENAQPPTIINDFWSQYTNETGKSVTSIWSTLHRHRVKLGTQDGIASFVKIIRKDDSTDYGYMAAVRGDPDAKEDTPDMHLVVIRNASRARAKGIEPMGEKEFLNLAETIAASVKRRPTQ